jgi:hypothetical protein
MALETQTCEDSPGFTIDCVLANGSRQLEADGCVLEYLEGGYQLTTPDHLRAGDLVKIQFMVGRRRGLYRHPAGASQKGSQALDQGGSDPGELR